MSKNDPNSFKNSYIPKLDFNSNTSINEVVEEEEEEEYLKGQMTLSEFLEVTEEVGEMYYTEQLKSEPVENKSEVVQSFEDESEQSTNVNFIKKFSRYSLGVSVKRKSSQKMQRKSSSPQINGTPFIRRAETISSPRNRSNSTAHSRNSVLPGSGAFQDVSSSSSSENTVTHSDSVINYNSSGHRKSKSATSFSKQQQQQQPQSTPKNWITFQRTGNTIRGSQRYVEFFHKSQKDRHVSTAYSKSFPTTDRISNKALWFYYDDAIQKYYENRIWSTSNSQETLPPAPLMLKREMILVKIEKHGEKPLDLEIPVNITVRNALRKSCEKFGIWEDYNYELFYPDKDRKLLESETLASLNFPEKPRLFLRKIGSTSSPTVPHALQRSTSLKKSLSQRIPGSIFGRSDLKRKFKSGGVYLSGIFFNQDKKILLTSNGLLPSFEIAKELPDDSNFNNFDTTNDDFLWILKRSLDFEKDNLEEVLKMGFSTSKPEFYLNDFRKAYLAAVEKMKIFLGKSPFGILYDEPIVISSVSATFIIIINDVSKNPHFSSPNFEPIKNNFLDWKNVSEMNPTIYHPSCDLWLNFSRIYRSRTTRISKGLYLGLFFASSTMTGFDLLVSKTNRHTIPLIKIRDEPDLDEDEWEWIKAESTSCLSNSDPMPIVDTTPRKATQVAATKSLSANSLSSLALSKPLKPSQSNSSISSTSSSNSFISSSPSLMNISQLYMLPEGHLIQRRTSKSSETKEIFEEEGETQPYREIQLDPTNNFKTLIHDGVEKLSEVSGLEFTSADLYKVSYINLDEESRIRVILFVKRMKGIGSNEIEFDTDAFVMRPLPLFETISNHVYHNSRSTAVRKKTFELEQKFLDLNEQLSRHLDDDVERRNMVAQITQIQKAIEAERLSWNSMSWSLKVLEWDRNRAWMRHSKKK